MLAKPNPFSKITAPFSATKAEPFNNPNHSNAEANLQFLMPCFVHKLMLKQV